MGGAGAGRDGRRVGLGAVEGEEGEAVAEGLHPDPSAHGRVEGILTVLKNKWTVEAKIFLVGKQIVQGWSKRYSLGCLN